MSCDADHDRTAQTVPAGDVLRLVVSLVAALLTVILPSIVRRPALAIPVLRATRALATAAWRHARTPGGDHAGLRAAALALRDALLAVVAADARCAGVGFGPPPRVAHVLSGMLAARLPDARPRDGPCALVMLHS